MTPLPLRLLVALAGAPLLSCLSASLPKAAAPDLYALDAPPRPAAAAATGPRTPIVLAQPRPAPGLEGRGMVYVPREHEIRYFARSAWVDSPGRMLAPLLARALEAGGAFQVVRDAAEGPARLRLETDVLRLQQEFTVRPSRIRLALRVRLVDATSRRILGDRELELVEPAPSDDPYGGVLAANAAVARALAEVAAACEGWARGVPERS